MKKHPLAIWLEKNGLTQADVARAFKKNRSRVHRIINGSKPSDDEMRILFTLTKGEVTADAIYGLPKGKKK